jgi:hypothetical protein
MVYEYSIPKNITSEDDINTFATEVNNKILEIGNSFNTLEDFVKFIYDNNAPADIHNQMSKSYGLPEVGSSALEWSVAYFFNQISMLLTGPEFLWTSIEEDIENGELCFSIDAEGKTHEITSVEELDNIMEEN